MLADWYRHQRGADQIVAWLSLERAENDPALFWRYVVGALRWSGFDGWHERRGDPAGARERTSGRRFGRCSTTSPPPIEPIVLILDDYHVVRGTRLSRAGRLPARTPARRAYACSSPREATRRCRWRRCASRASWPRSAPDDLRLTAEEAASFVRDTRGAAARRRRAGVADRPHRGLGRRHPPRGALAARRNRISAPRSWSSPATTGISSTISASRSSPALDPEVERFLLETSILTRFCAPLCDAVTGRGGGAESLAEIERANLFLVPLDGRRQWYRYHHLFGGLLQAELASRDPDLVPVLHRARVRLAPRARHGHRGRSPCDSRRRLLRRGGCDHRLLDHPDPLRALGDRAAVAAEVSRTRPSRMLPSSATSARSSPGSPAEPRPRWTTGCGSPSRWPRTPAAVRPDGRRDDLLRGQRERHPRRVRLPRRRRRGRDRPSAWRTAESRGGQWRVPAFATLGFLRHISGDDDAARAAIDEALGDRDAPTRPHGVIHALATLSLLELDDAEPERARRTAQRALDVAASVGLADSVTAGLAYVARGRSLVALGRPAEGVARARDRDRPARGSRPDRSPRLRPARAGGGPARRRRPGRGAPVGGRRGAPDRVLRRRRDLPRDARRAPGAVAARAQAPPGDAGRRAVGVRAGRAAPARRRPARAARSPPSCSVSANTVKTHVSSIYRKLGVGSRADAVRRAAELELI